MFHTFDTEVAEQFNDANIATLFQNLCYWIIHNKTNNKNKNDIEINGVVVERYFTFNSIQAFLKQFPYFSKKQIENYLNKLKEEGLITKGNFNKVGFDRTSWFCLVDEEYWTQKYLGKPKHSEEKTPEKKADTLASEVPEQVSIDSKEAIIREQPPVSENTSNIPEKTYTEPEIDPSHPENENLQFFHFPKRGNAFPLLGGVSHREQPPASENTSNIPEKTYTEPEIDPSHPENENLQFFHFPKRGNAFPQNGKPIPDINSNPKLKYKQNTAAAVRSTLCALDTTLILDGEFYPAAAEYLNRFELEEEYLRWFYQHLKKTKKINNFSGYFFTVFFRDVYVQRYKADSASQQNKQKERDMAVSPYSCPVCGQDQNISPETRSCSCCETPLNPSGEEIERYKVVYRMDDKTKEQYIFARCGVLRTGGNVSENLKELDRQFGIVV